jgi:hypothetical protein
LPPHLLNFTTLPWIEAGIAWGPAEEAVGDRKELAARLHRAVVRLKAWPGGSATSRFAGARAGFGPVFRRG